MFPLVIVLRFLKYVLSKSDGARKGLVAHRGKVISVEAPLGPVRVRITEDGYVDLDTGEESPSLVIKLTPDVAINWVKDGEFGWQGVQIEGDAHFASDLSRIVSKVNWDYEEDLARIFGDVIAHRLGNLVRGFGSWLSSSGHAMKSSFEEYLTEESHILVTPVSATSFIRDVDVLSDATSRLEKRVSERLWALRDNRKGLDK